jgi:hypothetical protein
VGVAETLKYKTRLKNFSGANALAYFGFAAVELKKDKGKKVLVGL